VASEELVDLAAEGFDAGVRLGQFIAADMVAVRLTRAFPLIVVASPGYLKQHGRPKHLGDLRDHACLRMRRTIGAVAPWTFVDRNKAVEAVVTGPLIANDFITVLSGAMEGMGLAQVPEPIALASLKAGLLERVLETFAPTTPGMFLYYPSRHQMMPKLRALVDHVKGRTAVTGKTGWLPERRRPRR
jgi:DNA-binding transcriptional LysR family regulator